jgi:arylsulfatase A-like enzyme
MDWTATMLAAAGVGAADDCPLDGIDLRPAFADANWRRPGDLCWRMNHRGQRALVRENWKYLHVDGFDYLFDIATDERERANLARRFPDRLTALRDDWQAWNARLPPIPADAKVFKLFGHEDMPTPSA